MEDMLGLVAGIGLAVAIAVVIVWVQKKKRARSWDAVVTDIRRQEIADQDGHYRVDFKIKYKRSDGKTGSLSLDENGYTRTFPGLKVGDRLSKAAGEDYPRVV